MRYLELSKTLTSDQIKQLVSLGVPRARLSDWKVERRHPTAAQMKLLALVTGTDPDVLLRELAELEASPEQLSFFRRAVERASAVAGVAVVAVSLVGAIAAPRPALASKSATFWAPVSYVKF